MSRPTSSDRREDYLEIAARMALEFDARTHPGEVEGLANVRVADVARRAGVSKGALYHIWPSQEAFRRDLVAHLLEREQAGALEDAARTARTLPPGAGADDALRVLAQAAFDRLKDDPAVYARFSFVPYVTEPELAHRLSREHRGFTDYFVQYLRSVGRRVRPPFTVEHLAGMAEAYLFGCLIRYRTSPDAVETVIDVDGEPWSLYVFGLRALLRGLSEPDPAGRAVASEEAP
jgi:AcrR family transcriptional regulator